MSEKLTGARRRAALEGLAGWTEVAGRDAIRKTFRFADFGEAWGFMSRVALAAEAMGHHPEWFNVYDRVEVTLTTHDVEGLSPLDIDLARRMDRIAGSRATSSPSAPPTGAASDRGADRLRPAPARA